MNDCGRRVIAIKRVKKTSAICMVAHLGVALKQASGRVPGDVVRDPFGLVAKIHILLVVVAHPEDKSAEPELEVVVEAMQVGERFAQLEGASKTSRDRESVVDLREGGVAENMVPSGRRKLLDAEVVEGEA